MTLAPRSVTINWDDAGNPTMTVAPPVTSPVVPPVQTGVLAYRIADFVESMGGSNTYSSDSATANIWGAWPGDNSKASIIKADAFFNGDTAGFSYPKREYSYAGRRAMQETFGKAVYAATGDRFTVCIGANGGIVDAQNLADMAIASSQSDGWIVAIEGVNEPNNRDFNGNRVDPAVTLACQKILWQAGVQTRRNKYPVRVLGPSIVAGSPYPEGWIMPFNGKEDGYFTTAQIAELRTYMEAISDHFYSPFQVDLPSGSPRGSWLRDRIAGLKACYGDLPIAFTEGHPSLYADKSQPGRKLDPVYDAYYGLTNFLSMFKAGIAIHHWYPLIDWGWREIVDPVTKIVVGHEPVFKTGFFPQTGGVAPRQIALALRALFRLTADTSPTKHTFATGTLDYTVDGISTTDTGLQTLLFQNAAGTFFPIVWRSQALPGGSYTPAIVKFGKQASSVQAYKLTDLVPDRQVLNMTGVSAVSLPMGGDAFLLRVTP